MFKEKWFVWFVKQNELGKRTETGKITPQLKGFDGEFKIKTEVVFLVDPEDKKVDLKTWSSIE